MFDKQDNSGVSPVIGVILMVAVTVALVALVTVTVFDLGGDVSESPDATVQLEETDGNISATLLRNENVDELYLQQGSTTWGDTDAQSNSASLPSGESYEQPMVNAGDTIDTSGFADQTGDNDSSGSIDGSEENTAQSGQVNVIAVIGGEEEVLTSTQIE